eukprot:4096445-Pleurochrysis_carterae.AAC.4
MCEKKRKGRWIRQVHKQAAGLKTSGPDGHEGRSMNRPESRRIDSPECASTRRESLSGSARAAAPLGTRMRSVAVFVGWSGKSAVCSTMTPFHAAEADTN